MKTVVAETVMLGREAFETLGEVEVIPDRAIGSEHLQDADALIADYITAALLHLSIDLEGKTLGIIGVGQVGSRVAQRAEALGLRVLLNDPPRAAREVPTLGTNGVGFQGSASIRQTFSNAWKNEAEHFQALETLLKQADIVTMHVPLVAEKPWPTLRMADCRFFEKMKRGSVFINAARGKVLDSDALLHAKENGIISHTILDVWDPEPCIRADILDIANIGTAHIAGHSLEGKLNGTIHTYHEACHFFEIDPIWDLAPLLPALVLPELKIDSREKTDQDVLAEAALAAYNIATDDNALRSAPSTFDSLRANYGVRREFFNTRVILSEERPALIQKLRTLGFKT